MISKGKRRYLVGLYPWYHHSYFKMLTGKHRNSQREPVPFADQVISRDFYAGCKRLDHEVDFEVFFNRTDVDKCQHLVINRSKPRPVGNRIPVNFDIVDIPWIELAEAHYEQATV